MWSLNSQPQDQESHTLPTEPARCPSNLALMEEKWGAGREGCKGRKMKDVLIGRSY